MESQAVRRAACDSWLEGEVKQTEELVIALRAAWDQAGKHRLDEREDTVWCIECAAEYTYDVADTPDGLECPNAENVSKEGYCYQIAGSALIQSGLDDAILVHATVNGYIAHAWLEYEGYAFDFSRREVIEGAEDYRSLRSAQNISTYTLHQAASQMVNEGHWGPWTARSDQMKPAQC